MFHSSPVLENSSLIYKWSNEIIEAREEDHVIESNMLTHMYLNIAEQSIDGYGLKVKDNVSSLPSDHIAL